MTHHNYGDAILSDIGEVMKLMLQGKDSTLKSDYNAHELDDELRGFRSIHLYPGEKENGPKDVVILFKIHSNDHLVLHGIGNHAYVYPKYQTIQTDKKQKRKRRRRN